MNAVWPAMSSVGVPPRPDRIAVSARGTRVRFADGSVRLCATSGLWNVPLGYGHPGIADAVAGALRDASYLTLFRAVHRPAQDAADALLDLVGADTYRHVVFSTSGGAANDAVMKLARQFHIERGEPGRTIVVGLRGSYHGTMYGSHALSGDALGQAAYALDRRAVRHVDADDPAELRAVLHREGSRVAAVVVEPLRGSGAYPVSSTFIETALDLRDQYGFLLVADEVATGFGRTGPLFASGEWSRTPDLLVLSKALTNGALGAAAVLVGSRVSSLFAERRSIFVHGETQAGTPPVAAAILAVTAEFRRPDLLVAVARVSKTVRDLADALVRDGVAVEVRGRGAFLAVALTGPAGGRLSADRVPEAVAAIAAAGAIVHPGVDGIQLVPGYGYGAADFAELDRAIRTGWARMAEGWA